MDVLMPQPGETVAEGKITQWFKSAGDAIKPGDNLFEIETDKVSMEVPATSAGVLAEIRVDAGEVAPVGAVVAVIADVTQRRAPAQAPVGRKPVAQAEAQRATASAAVLPQAEVRPTPPLPPALQPLDPFREVRTPERNFGPARLANAIVITPLARRLAAEAGL